MASLTGNLISTTYQGILKTQNNASFSGTPVRITDGLGNNSSLALSPTSASIFGNAQVSGTLFVDGQDVNGTSIVTEGSVVAGREGYYNVNDGGYTRLVHTDTVIGGLAVEHPYTLDRVIRDFTTNNFYITTNAPVNSGSIYIQPSGLDKLIVRASTTISGSRAVPVQITGSVTVSGSITSALGFTGNLQGTADNSLALSGFGSSSFALTGSNTFTGNQTITGSVKVSGSLVLSANSHFVFPTSQPASPLTGSAYFSGNFLYVYNGTKFVSASFS